MLKELESKLKEFADEAKLIIRCKARSRVGQIAKTPQYVATVDKQMGSEDGKRWKQKVDLKDHKNGNKLQLPATLARGVSIMTPNLSLEISQNRKEN